MDHATNVEALLEKQTSVIEVSALLEAKSDHSICAHNFAMDFRQLTKLKFEASTVVK